MEGLEAAAHRAKSMQCIDFSGRVFEPRRDVRSVEHKHGLPMAENESPCPGNSITA